MTSRAFRSRREVQIPRFARDDNPGFGFATRRNRPLVQRPAAAPCDGTRAISIAPRTEFLWQ
jgi:hypothetical protein